MATYTIRHASDYGAGMAYLTNAGFQATRSDFGTFGVQSNRNRWTRQVD